MAALAPTSSFALAALGVSQQTVQAYAVDRTRLQVAALPTAARTLSMSLEELFGEDTQARRSKRGPASKLENQLERVSTLPRPRQHMVIDVIEAMLAQHSS